MRATVYVEGGGDRKQLQIACRRAFGKFFTKAGLANRLPKVVACGGRTSAYGDFRYAVESNADQGRTIFLLVDSEAPVTNSEPWRHLKGRDNWDRPRTAAADSAHLMVQCMEAWFYADKDALKSFFGPDFNTNALSGNEDIEDIPKQDVQSGLAAATRQANKGSYHKGRHSFDILELIDPNKVSAASSHARRLVEALRKALSSS